MKESATFLYVNVYGCFCSLQFLEASVETAEPSPPPPEETDDADDLVRLALFVHGWLHPIDIFTLSLSLSLSIVLSAVGYDVNHTILASFFARMPPHTHTSMSNNGNPK